jgi:glycosyltransferase involved in cell wall biosynthesis
MRICHVCSAHSADDGRVFHRACVSLAQAGYDVHLIAGGPETEPYERQGVTVHPLPEWRSRLERIAGRFRVAEKAAALKPDLYHVHEPELLGPVLARAGGKPVIWDVHESYLDVLVERQWIPTFAKGAARHAWDWRERRLVARCAGVAVVTERIAQRYRSFHANVEVVANFPDLSKFTGLPPVARDGRTCSFIGGIDPDQGLTEAVKALAVLRGRGLDVSLVLAGTPVTPEYLEELFAIATRLGVRDLVLYKGVLPKSEAILLQNEVSIGLVPYLPLNNNIVGMPNKLLESMALGLPVVYSDFPSYQEVAGEYKAGVAVDPTKPEAIADAIEYLVRSPDAAREMGQNGKRGIRERFNWSVEREKLLALYQRALGKHLTSEPNRVSASR